jgi:hypothetical protein
MSTNIPLKEEGKEMACKCFQSNSGVKVTVACLGLFTMQLKYWFHITVSIGK